MANVPTRTRGPVVHYQKATGTGTDLDPFIPEVQLRGYDEVGDINRFTSMQKKFRDSFTQDLSVNWDPIVIVGNGNATRSAGVLTVTAGDQATSRVEMTSRETFTIPFIYAIGLLLSARIANNLFIIEAISVDSETLLPDGRHSVGWYIDGTTATQAKYAVQNGGLRPLISAASTIPTTASYSILEMEPTWNESWFHTRPIDSSAARSQSYVRHQQLPDPNALYKLRIISLNVASLIDVTNAQVGASNKIRLTVASHGATTGNSFWVDSLNGVTDNGNEVRGSYVVTVIDANTIDLDGTVFGGTYVTGSGRAGRQVAPAGNTTMSVQYFTCGDYSEVTVEVVAGRGGTVAGQALPVAPVSAASTPVTSATAIDAGFPNPHPIGVRAASANPTAMSASGDMAGMLATMLGSPVVTPHAIPESTWSYPAASGGITNTADVPIKTAAGAGIRNYVDSVQIRNQHASVATEVVIKDGSTIIWRQHYAANSVPDNVPFSPPLRGTANTAVNVACITTGAAVYVNAQGHIGP